MQLSKRNILPQNAFNRILIQHDKLQMATVSVENIFKLETVLSDASKSIFATGSMIAQGFHWPADPPNLLRRLQPTPPQLWGRLCSPVLGSHSSALPKSISYAMENMTWHSWGRKWEHQTTYRTWLQYFKGIKYRNERLGWGGLWKESMKLEGKGALGLQWKLFGNLVFFFIIRSHFQVFRTKHIHLSWHPERQNSKQEWSCNPQHSFMASLMVKSDPDYEKQSIIHPGISQYPRSQIKKYVSRPQK